jgi:hypothetical protein
MRSSRSRFAWVAALFLSLSVISLTGQQPPDIFKTLGVSVAAGNDSILTSFASGSITLPGTRAVFTAATPDARATMVRAVIATARAYSATDDFAQRYASFRASQRPERAPMPQNGDEALAAQMKQLEDVAKEALKAAENMPPQAREDLIENIEFTKRQLAELNKDPKHRATVDAATKEAAKAAAEELQQAMARYEADYPAEITQLITNRLRAFLAMSATVDFSAKTVERDDRKLHFVDPSYESMPKEWKMLFRAGKPAVDAAREAAQIWLNALGG